MDGSILDHFYVRKSLFSEYYFNVALIIMFFSDHYVAQIKIQK